MAEEYLDFSQALDALNITETELWELIHSGTLKAYRAGGVIKFKKSDIIAYQKSRGTEPTIVVSRKMLDSMDDAGEDEEGMDTEVGLRASSRRASDDDLATSEITARESAVGEGEDTAPVDSRARRPAASRTAATTARSAAPASVRSKRISQVLDTEKKGNPIINVVMILCCLVFIYGGLVQLATLKNSTWTSEGIAKISRPGWIGQGFFDWGTRTGGGEKSGLVEILKAKPVIFPFEGMSLVPNAEELQKKYDEMNKPPEEKPEELPENPEGAGEN